MFSRINAWLHLWLGLIAGIVVIIVSVTGCVLVFEAELKYLFTDYIRVDEQEAEMQVPPSAIYQSVSAQYPDKEVASVWYYGLDKSVKVNLEGSDSLIFVNPYTAEILGVVDHEDFFHFMDEGHRHLWLPLAIGRPIVGWATFTFVVLLISGTILWWPKTGRRRHLRQAFTVNWKGRFKRINYDLHNVLGFYALTFAAVMALTGLIMSFPWFRQSVVWTTGGYPDTPKAQVVSAGTPPDSVVATLNEPLWVADQIWYTVRREIARHNTEAVIVHFPHDDEREVYACTDMYAGAWRDLYFDRSTLALLPRSAKPMADTNPTEWTMRSNYGLHTGEVGGLTTKILYFFASLICASLPITGFYIWWGKKAKKRKKKRSRTVTRKSGAVQYNSY